MKAKDLIRILEQNSELPVCIITKATEKDSHLMEKSLVDKYEQAWEIETCFVNNDNYIDEAGEDREGDVILIWG